MRQIFIANLAALKVSRQLLKATVIKLYLLVSQLRLATRRLLAIERNSVGLLAWSLSVFGVLLHYCLSFICYRNHI